jgi:hypothetical protein
MSGKRGERGTTGGRGRGEREMVNIWVDNGKLAEVVQCVPVHHRGRQSVTQGQEEVGKTNLITRFIRDEFIEARNLKLEGEQTAIFIVNNCRFKLVFRDSLSASSPN